MLKHEDALAGMMGQFVVIDQTAGVDNLEMANAILYPNPTMGSFLSIQLKNKAEHILAYSVINQLGQIIKFILTSKTRHILSQYFN